MGTIHAASLATSARLARVQDLLADGADHTTWEIMMGARVAAASTAVAELRAQGAVITCRQDRNRHGRRVWTYRMIAPAGTTMQTQGQQNGD